MNMTSGKVTSPIMEGAGDSSSYPAQTSPVTCGVSALAAVASRMRYPGYATASRARSGQVQERLHRISARTGFPWPRRLGTSPWALARLAGGLTGNRFAVSLFRPTPRRDAGKRRGSFDGPAELDTRAFAGSGVRALLRAIETDADCFLYVGGTNRASGIDRWIPRHVVTVLGSESDRERAQIFEPASGRVFAVPIEDLLVPSGRPRPEFGNWCYIQLVVAPVETERRFSIFHG